MPSSEVFEKRIAGDRAGTSVNLRRIRLALGEKNRAEALEYVNRQNGAPT
jgi:hypothetical protein